MTVSVRKFNNKREVISVDKFRVSNVKLQPAGLIELAGGDLTSTLYIRFLATDQTDILIVESEQ